MKKINLSLALFLLCATGSFLSASQLLPKNNCLTRPLSIQPSTQQPSPREPEAHTPITTQAPPSRSFECSPVNSQDDEHSQSDYHGSIVMSPKHLQDLLHHAHATRRTSQAVALTPTEQPNQRWLDGLTATALSGAAASAGCVAHQHIAYIVTQYQNQPQQPPTRFYVPGMETVALGAGQWSLAAGSSIATLGFFALAAYKLNRVFSAPWRYKLQEQKREFADVVQDLTAQLQTYQTATDAMINAITERANRTQKTHRTLAEQTQNELVQQSKQINLLRAALTSNFGILKNFATFMQAQGNQSATPQLPTILAQAEQANTQLQQAQPQAPHIDIAPMEGSISTTPPAPIRPQKIKSNNGCCCCQ